jgi:hypothetical protein
VTTGAAWSVSERVDEHEVLLDVPAATRSLRLIRLAAADAAADLGLDVDGVEAARIAVDELAALLFDTGRWTRLMLRLRRGEGSLEVEGQVRGSDGDVGPVQVDRVVEELLRSCTESFHVQDRTGDPGPWFTCTFAARAQG